MHFRDRVASKYWYDTIQNTRYGCLEGYRSGKTLVFRAVPYGKAERWSLPEYPDAWDGVRDATLSGPMGIHVNCDGVLTGVEDCLYMDIYRPDTQQTGLPVMFFLHGGNNQIDGADQVDFTEFAYAANVIAISVNYRLGALGFNPLRAIKGEDPAQASGNFAILDAIRGLSWVRNNIVSFGGNPGNITIAGFSSGGRDVMALLISPDAKGYFQKAISFSGGMTTAEIEPSQKIFAEHLAPLVVEDHVKPYLSEAEEWLLSDAPEVRDYLLGLPAGRLAKAFGPAYIRMKEFPHLYPDGIVLDSMGFKSKTFTTVPLMMETGTDEFSIYAAQDPYFAPYVADRSILTNEKMRKEFEFAKKYGSAMYRLFNADAPASMLVGKYRAPIYTLTIDYGDDPKIVGDAAALLLGSVHGIWIPCVTGRATSTTADFPIHAFDNPGFQDMKRMIQQYIGNFMRTGNPNGNGLPEWQKWMTAKDGFGSLVIHTDGNTAAAGQITAHETYEDVIRALEADDSIDPEAKDIIIHHVLSGRWWSGPIDRHFSHKEN